MDLISTGITMPLFAESLSQMMSRQVVDKTNLKGAFDIKLRWRRENLTPIAGDVVGEPGGPSIFTAIQEQLGFLAGWSSDTKARRSTLGPSATRFA
jgi:uncharacterized protein (TIGR03435 family)